MYDVQPIEEINSQYRIWRKNAPYLYNIVFTQQLASPSLTAEWLTPNEQFKEDGYNACKVVYATNLETNNHIIVGRVKIPLQSPNPNANNRAQSIGLVEEARYDKISTLAMIPHEGPVCRARCNPFKTNQIASKSESGKIYLLDYFDYRSDGAPGNSNPLNIYMNGHKGYGFGLCWSHKKYGQLFSCGNDAQVLLWELGKFSQRKQSTNFSRYFKFHYKSVGDVATHFHHGDVFMTGDDAGQIAIWDQRERGSQPIFNKKVVDGELYSLTYCPTNEYVLAVGGSNKTVAIWDMRNMDSSLFYLQGHTDDVTKIEWSSRDQNLLWSSSTDTRIIAWDLSERRYKFIHAGHRSAVSDFNISCTEAYGTILSVEEEGIMHIHQPNPVYLRQ